MKKICIFFTGAIREDFEFIKNNIYFIKNNFKDYNVTTIFHTWYPMRDNYDYDYYSFKKEIEKNIDILLFSKQENLSEYPRCRNNSPPLYFYSILEIFNYINKNNLKFDFIVRTRNDLEIKIKNIEKFLDGNIYVPKLFWYDALPNHTNDHFFIASFEDFEKINNLTEEKIKLFCQNSHNCEEFNSHVLQTMSDKKIFLIDDNDLNTYILRKERKFIQNIDNITAL